jgi:DNA-binding LacI/PurR family transcriptional regulator
MKEENIDYTRITLQDIAREAKCSPNTVSLALRDSQRISPEMRKRVQALARQLKYTPNFAARHLRRRRSGMIGVYTYTLHDAVRTELVNRLLQELRTAEYRPVLGVEDGFNGSWYDSPWMETFRELNVEALVIINNEVTELPEWSKNIPVVVLGCEPNESLPCDYLALDRAEAAQIGITHLVERGHQKILLACLPQCSFGQGALKAMKKYRCKTVKMPLPELNPLDIQQSRLMGYTYARQSDGPTAALFGDSGLAAGFISGTLDRQGHVPEDIAVVGYDYFPWADMLAVPLTTVEQPIHVMASTAVELVKKRLADPEAPPIHIVQPHSLVIRKST